VYHGYKVLHEQCISLTYLLGIRWLGGIAWWPIPITDILSGFTDRWCFVQESWKQIIMAMRAIKNPTIQTATITSILTLKNNNNLLQVIHMYHAWGLALRLWCLTPLSTTFQLYRGGQCYWCRKPEYPEKTTDLPVCWSKKPRMIMISIRVAFSKISRQIIYMPCFGNKQREHITKWSSI